MVSLQITLVSLLLISITSAASLKVFTTEWRFFVKLRGAHINSLAQSELTELLGQGGMSEQYMKVRSTDSFAEIQRNAGQACATTVDIEDLSAKYFPRYIRTVRCDNNAGQSCKPSDPSFACVQTTIVKHVLKKDDRRVMAVVDSANTTIYYDLWKKEPIQIGVGCECSN